MRLTMLLLFATIAISACSNKEGYRYIGDTIPDQTTPADEGAK